jgi:hypothetical protein
MYKITFTGGPLFLCLYFGEGTEVCMKKCGTVPQVSWTSRENPRLGDLLVRFSTHTIVARPHAKLDDNWIGQLETNDFGVPPGTV